MYLIAIRFFSVLLGALPATWLALLAGVAVAGSLENFGLHPVRGTLGVLWGVSGILGAIGSWLIIFDVGSKSKATRRLVIAMVCAGIAAASVLLLDQFPTMSRPSFLPITFLLCIASAISVGVFQLCRVSAASSWVILGRVAMAYVIAIGFVKAEPLYTNVVETERLMKWECWIPGCKENTDAPWQYIRYSFSGGNSWYQMEASNGLLFNLRALKSNVVPAKLRVETRFGRFESFTIVEFAGFPIEGGTARNSNQMEPPFPTQGIDDDARDADTE